MLHCVCQTDMFNSELMIITHAVIMHDDPTWTSTNRRLQFDIINVLIDLFIHLNILRICLAAAYGPWSEYGDCGCDLLQSRTRACDGDECVSDDVETIACECVPFNAAGMMFCTTSIVVLHSL